MEIELEVVEAYEQGQRIPEIARARGESPARIWRMVKQAREDGLVRRSPDPRGRPSRDTATPTDDLVARAKTQRTKLVAQVVKLDVWLALVDA